MLIRKVLCVCIGNGGRSPSMAAVLGLFLKNAGHEVVCESAGVGEDAAKGGGATPFALAAAKRVGIDLSGHTKRRIASLNLAEYNLIVCASDEIAAQVIQVGADMKKVYNARINNPWHRQLQADYDATFEQILVAMYRVVTRFFSS